MAFYIVVSFDHDAPAISHRLQEQIMTKYPGKTIRIIIDTNYSG